MQACVACANVASISPLFALAAQQASAYRDSVSDAVATQMREAFDAPTPQQGWAASKVIKKLVLLSGPACAP